LGAKKGDLYKSVIEVLKRVEKRSNASPTRSDDDSARYKHICILSGTGDVVEPEDGKIAAIGMVAILLYQRLVH